MTAVAAIVLISWFVLSCVVAIGVGRVFRTSPVQAGRVTTRPLDETDPSGLAHR